MLFLLATTGLLFAWNLTAMAQAKYTPGDRVECEITGTLPGKYWMKGSIMPFQPGDFGPGMQPDGSWYHFKSDANGVEYPCKPQHIRPIVGAKTTPKDNKDATTEGAADIKEAVRGNRDDAAVGATDSFLNCPIEQKQVKIGSRPDSELFKKIIRCSKGEKPVEKGDEGAVKVDVSAIQIGAARPWSYSQDSGNSKPGTVVYPVKATYTVKTLYRTATDVQENWIRILNFYVNAFGEWQIGSEEPIKSPKLVRVPKD